MTPEIEVCGFIADNQVISCKNTAEDPSQNFKLSTRDTTKLLSFPKDAVWVYHSHPAHCIPDFSKEDIIFLDEAQLKGLLISLPTGNTRFYDPKEIKPYEDRSWADAYQNCYTLARDFYLKEYGLSLGRYYLNSIEASNASEWDLFSRNAEQEGFIPVEVNRRFLQKGDILGFTISPAKNINHIAVVWSSERNEILHHPGNQNSRIEQYRPAYERYVTAAWRHQDLF